MFTVIILLHSTMSRPVFADSEERQDLKIALFANDSTICAMPEESALLRYVVAVCVQIRAQSWLALGLLGQSRPAHVYSDSEVRKKGFGGIRFKPRKHGVHNMKMCLRGYLYTSIHRFEQCCSFKHFILAASAQYVEFTLGRPLSHGSHV